MEPAVVRNAAAAPASPARNSEQSSFFPSGKTLLYCLSPFVVYGLFLVVVYILSTPILFFVTLITALGIGRLAEITSHRQQRWYQSSHGLNLIVTQAGDHGAQPVIGSTSASTPAQNAIVMERSQPAKRNNIFTEAFPSSSPSPGQVAVETDAKAKLPQAESGDGKNVVLTEAFPENALQYTPLVYHQLREYSDTGIPIESVTGMLENLKQEEQSNQAAVSEGIQESVNETEESRPIIVDDTMPAEGSALEPERVTVENSPETDTTSRKEEPVAETLYKNEDVLVDPIAESKSSIASDFNITDSLIPEILEVDNDNRDRLNYSDPNLNYEPSKVGIKPEHIAIPFSAFPERRISSMNPLVLNFNDDVDERFHLAVDHPELFVIKSDEQ